jgi:hypothetical protein
MRFGKLLLLVLGVFALGACNNAAKKEKAAAEAAASKAADLAASNMDLMQGRWLSEKDSTYVLEIKGDQMSHINGGKLTVSTTIKPDVNCTNSACTFNNEQPTGFCFIESAQDDMCHKLVECDGEVLKYYGIGTTGQMLSFKKIN